MWKKEDGKTTGVSEISTTPAASASTAVVGTSAVRETASPAPPLSPRAAACISQGIRIKGEVTGSEDLFVDGHVDGKLSLTNGSLTIGPNGTVKADVSAREVIVRGKIDGKVFAREKVALWSTGQVNGEVQTDRLAIEDGALLRGKVEAGKQPSKGSETQVAAAAGAATSGGKQTSAVSSSTAAD
ncbi:MAG TPA: polymer-forming cytoskeletal protein [Candidatus Methylomirabilis sp.]|nr:polymer-forming cytoskeletal protein [Candidatus Methylomirabilis sp.]